MDCTDTLVKIGVGACLGFGIIALARLARRNDGRGNGSDGRSGSGRKQADGSPENWGDGA
jgi:hypothetical protein